MAEYLTAARPRRHSFVLAGHPTRQKDLRSRRTAWQPYLRAALDKNLIDCAATLADLDEAGFVVDADQVETQLLESCRVHRRRLVVRTGRRPRAGHLALKPMSSGQQASVRLDVAGVTTPSTTHASPPSSETSVSIGMLTQSHCTAPSPAGASWSRPATPSPSWPASVPICESAPLEADSIAELVAAQGTLANLFAADVLADLYPPVRAWRRKNSIARAAASPLARACQRDRSKLVGFGIHAIAVDPGARLGSHLSGTDWSTAFCAIWSSLRCAVRHGRQTEWVQRLLPS